MMQIGREHVYLVKITYENFILHFSFFRKMTDTRSIFQKLHYFFVVIVVVVHS
jgi:hypothetical protein